MSIKSLIFAVIENIIKVVILAALIMYIFKGVTLAYDFGYKVFADTPMSANSGRIITIGVAEGASTEDVANMLEEKGLIENAKRFMIQEYLSAYHGEIKPGIYDLSTDMTASEMIEIMSTEKEEEPNIQNVEENIEESEEALEGEDGLLEDTENMEAIGEPIEE